jgi:hypothetical protein
LEVQQCAEWGHLCGFLANLDLSPAHSDPIDIEGRSMMR